MPNSDSRSKLVFNIKYLSRNNYARSFSAQEHLQENHPHSPKAQRSHNRFLNMKSYSFFSHKCPEALNIIVQTWRFHNRRKMEGWVPKSIPFLIKPKPKKLYNWRNRRDLLFGRRKSTETDAFFVLNNEAKPCATSNFPQDTLKKIFN